MVSGEKEQIASRKIPMSSFLDTKNARAEKKSIRLFSELISQANPGNRRDAYFTVRPVITMDGDNAKGDWMLYIFIADPVTGVFSRFNHMRRGNYVYD
jgi:hypothetical protein